MVASLLILGYDATASSNTALLSVTLQARICRRHVSVNLPVFPSVKSRYGSIITLICVATNKVKYAYTNTKITKISKTLKH